MGEGSVPQTAICCDLLTAASTSNDPSQQLAKSFKQLSADAANAELYHQLLAQIADENEGGRSQDLLSARDHPSDCDASAI